MRGTPPPGPGPDEGPGGPILVIAKTSNPFSRYYADFMHEYFGIPHEKFRYVSLGIDMADLDASKVSVPRETPEGPPVIGYLARLAPEKGLHHLVDAFISLRQSGTLGAARLKIAGWLGKNHEEYAETQFEKLRQAGLGDDFEYVGSVDRGEKILFLRSLDVLSVPTVYRDPKGLFLLEALAAGVPVVQPTHGAFPELLEATGGGLLVPPEDPEGLAAGIAAMLADRDLAREKGLQAAQVIRQRLTADEAAKETVEVYRNLIAQSQQDPALARA
jgi:glycosyltransferase involved in cell wall biosynthesis